MKSILLSIALLVCTIRVFGQGYFPVDTKKDWMTHCKKNSHENFIPGHEKQHGQRDVRDLILLDSIYGWQWDSPPDGWAEDYRINSIEYGPFNLPSVYVQQYWDGTGWENEARYILTYASPDQVINELEQEWNGVGWENDYQTIYSFDKDGNKTKELFQVWSSNAWKDNFQLLYTYDSENNLTHYLFQDWKQNQWVNFQQITYTYDDQNNLLTDLQEQWINNAWEASSKDERTYDGTNHLITLTLSFWTGAAWDPTELWTYSYDGNDNQTSLVSQSWDGSTWTDTYRILDIYDAENQHTFTLSEVWNDTAWVESELSIYTYGLEGLLVGESTKTFDPGDMVVIYGDSTHYYYHTATSVRDEQKSNPEIAVYPNPVHGSLTIFSSIPMESVEVFNAQGESLETKDNIHGVKTEMDLSSLGKGIYFLRMTNGIQCWTKNIVVQ